MIPTLNFWQLGLILFIFLVIIFIFYRFTKKNQNKIENNNEYGSAKFANEKDLHKTFEKENLHNIKEFGFPIYFDKDLNYMLVDRQTPHWLFLGSTGSGKSLTAVKPQAGMIATAKNKRSVFFSDPKGELFNDTAKMFKDNGYEVKTLDFRNPTLSNKLNILEPVIEEWENYFQKKRKANKLELQKALLVDDYQKAHETYLNSKNLERKSQAEDLLTRLEDEIIILDDERDILTNEYMSSYGEACSLVLAISDMITQEANAKDPFWNNSAGNLLSGLIFYFLEQYENEIITRDQITLNMISKFQISTTSEANSKKFKQIVEQIPYNYNSKLKLTPIIGSAENTYKSITAVFGQKMAIFNDLSVANVTSKSDFSFDALGKGIETVDENGNKIIKPVALYIIIKDEDETFNVLISLIVGLMYKRLVKLAVNSPKGKVPINIVFMLDEFANCPAFSGIESMVTVARSRGMMFQFFIQELAQLDKVYGKEVGNIIRGNAGLVYLKTTSQETAKAVSERLGKQTISTTSYSRGIGWKESFNGNRNTSLMGRELFTPDEIMNLEYKTIIFPIKKSDPIFRDTIPFFTFEKKNHKFYEGTVERTPYLLSLLDNNVFTVEKVPGVDFKSSREELMSRNESRRVLERNRRRKVMGQQDINLLKPAMEQAKQVLKSNVFSEDIKESENGSNYGIIITKKQITKEQESLLQKINKNQNRIAYKIDTDNENNKSKISIHIVNVINAMQNWIDISTLPVDLPPE